MRAPTPPHQHHIPKTALVGPRHAGKSEFLRMISEVFPVSRSEDEMLGLTLQIKKKTITFLRSFFNFCDPTITLLFRKNPDVHLDEAQLAVTFQVSL